MPPATWYLGPLGDLRPLVSPDGGVTRTVPRYGGMHRGLSGAPTVDVTGHRAAYNLEIPWLTPDELRFLDALHYRTVPGPLWLLDPMSANRLTRPAALLQDRAMTLTSGSTAPVDGPADVGVPVAALDWTGYVPGAALHLPRVPLVTDPAVTFTVWARSTTPGPLALAVDFTGPDGVDLGSVADTAELGADWRRVGVTAPVPPEATAARARLVPAGGDHVALAAPQIDSDTAPTPWDTGGAVLVLVDQLERTSPQYPRTDVVLTLVEV